MNRRIEDLIDQAKLTAVLEMFESELIALVNSVVAECVQACDEVAQEADQMTKSKFVTDAGRMLHEGMWGGAQNCRAGIINRFGEDK